MEAVEVAQPAVAAVKASEPQKPVESAPAAPVAQPVDMREVTLVTLAGAEDGEEEFGLDDVSLPAPSFGGGGGDAATATQPMRLSNHYRALAQQVVAEVNAKPEPLNQSPRRVRVIRWLPAILMTLVAAVVSFALSAELDSASAPVIPDTFDAYAHAQANANANACASFRDYRDEDVHRLTHLDLAVNLEQYLDAHPEEMCAASFDVGRVWRHVVVRVPWSRHNVTVSQAAAAAAATEATYQRALVARRVHHRSRQEWWWAVARRSWGYVVGNDDNLEHELTQWRQKLQWLHLVNLSYAPTADSVMVDTVESRPSAPLQHSVRHSDILVHFTDLFRLTALTTEFRDEVAACIQHYHDLDDC